MSSRGLSPVVGVVCLVGITVVLAATVGVAVPSSIGPEPTLATFDVAVEPDGELRVTHQGGDAIDPDSISLHVRVDGEPLAEQPPVPFFSASGFESAPTGAFNSATGGTWRTGETASLHVAATNAPAIEVGDTISIRLSVEGNGVVKLETTV